MNNLKPTSFEGCLVVHPAIGIVQQKIIRPGAKPKKRGNVHSSIPFLKMKAKPAAIIRPKATTHFHKKAAKAKAMVTPVRRSAMKVPR